MASEKGGTMPTRRHAVTLSVGALTVLVVAISGWMSTGASAQAPAAKTPIKIGVLSPLTGPLAALARDVVDGARLYVDEVHGEMALLWGIRRTSGRLATRWQSSRCGSSRAPG